MKNKIFDVVMPVLPKNDLSHFVGRLVHIPLPQPVGRRSVEWFAKMYDIDLSEAELPVDQYRSIGDLFMRKLKAGVRPVGEGVVHPADAVITEGGPIENQTLIQAKGKTYTVSELLKTDEWTTTFDGGQFMTYYLCPTDYHRVHSPVDGRVVWSSHIPGELWPVNAWSVNAIHNLFAVNERVALVIDTPKGKIALIMVAATNVGNMTMTFDPSIATTKRPANRKVAEKTYDPALEIARADEVGIFRMGSTVVMLYEKGALDVETAAMKNHHSKMGASVRA
ncbi:MAG: archaetidylserine decarboxylase [Bdellovibrionota bacterium]